MSKKIRLWLIAAIVGVAVSLGVPVSYAAQSISQDGGYNAPFQVQEVDRTGDEGDGLWGLLGLAGLLGLLGLLRRPARRDAKNALAGYPAANSPVVPDANAAHTPPGGQPIPPQARSAPLPGEIPAPGSGELASEKPLRRWP